MKIKEVCAAIDKLPADMQEYHLEDAKISVFNGRLIIVAPPTPIMVYTGQRWEELDPIAWPKK